MQDRPETRFEQVKARVVLWSVPSILLLIVVKLLYNKLHSRHLLRIPGPGAAAYTRYWRVYSVWRGEAHRDAIALHQKHGSLVRIAPNVISVSDAAAVPYIYSLSEKCVKTAFYPMQSLSWKKVPTMNLFSETDPALHRQEKKKIAKEYSMTSLLQAEFAVDSCTEILMSQLAERCTKPVDLGEWLQWYAFDVLGEVTFAKRLGFLEQAKDVANMIGSIRTILTYAAIVGQVPEWHRVLLGNPILNRFTAPMEEWDALLMFTIKTVRSSTDQDPVKAAAKKTAHANKGYAMLSQWQLPDSGMSEKDIVTAASANIFAGSDTTAITLRSIVDRLLRDPSSLRRVRKEIDAAQAAGKLSTPVSHKECQAHLQYLMAAMKEGMRMHPSLGLLLERHVPPEGATVCDQFLPGGTIIGINAWTLCYDPSNFSSPEEFRPERWLSSPEPTLQSMESILGFNFGGGARTCIGKNVAIMEMPKVLAELFRRFDIELTRPEREMEVTNRWFVQQKGLVCTLKPRSTD